MYSISMVERHIRQWAFKHSELLIKKMAVYLVGRFILSFYNVYHRVFENNYCRCLSFITFTAIVLV